MGDAASVLDYHRLTSHAPGLPIPDDPRLLPFRRMDWARRPPPFKVYPGREPFRLPRELTLPGPALDAAGLGCLLFLTAGVVRFVDGGERVWFRAAGSAGGLCPIEVYVVPGDLDGLDAGLYHYEPVQHALVRLRAVPPGLPPALVLTGIPWRTAWKYAERGWRHLWWDAGTMLGQLLAVCEHARLRPAVELGFADADVAALVGADGVDELALAVVGLDGEAALPAPEPVPAGHLADDPLELPMVLAAHRAGDLGTADHVAEWRAAAAAFAAAPASDPVPSPLADPVEVVRRRGSTRAFDTGRAAPTEVLTEGLAWATQAVPGDFVARGGTLLEHGLAVHTVSGRPPGSYRWQGGELEQLAAGPMRSVTARLCLDQELGGQGAFTAFHCSRLGAVLASLGPRGYRAAQLEAGVVHGRLCLAAFAYGLGATGLTFFDDLVSRFFGTEASPMLATAVGAPAYRSQPGGLPGRPVQLRPRLR